MKPNSQEAAPPTKGERGVLCAKCEHLNAPELHACERCGAHLYIKCNSCGHRNPRVRSRCGECGQRMHRTFWHKWEKKILGKQRKITLYQVIFVIIAAYVAYRIIVKIVEYEPPVPE
jgi:hypothetical protein